VLPKKGYFSDFLALSSIAAGSVLTHVIVSEAATVGPASLTSCISSPVASAFDGARLSLVLHFMPELLFRTGGKSHTFAVVVFRSKLASSVYTTGPTGIPCGDSNA
jgi:hypothetical protein